MSAVFPRPHLRTPHESWRNIASRRPWVSFAPRSMEDPRSAEVRSRSKPGTSWDSTWPSRSLPCGLPPATRQCATAVIPTNFAGPLAPPSLPHPSR